MLTSSMRHTALSVSILVLFLVFFAKEPASADDQRDNTFLLEDVVVTATMHESKLADVPASVSVITEEEIQSQSLPNSDIGDVLRSVPGITLRRAYSPFPAYPNIRGQGSDATIVLVNGMKTNWEIAQAIPPDNVERIEVIRGASSALYGANGNGGVINIIVKKGRKEEEKKLKVGYGSFNTQKYGALLNGRANRFGYSLAGDYIDSDGENVVKNQVISSIHMIDDCEYEKKRFSMNTDYQINDNSSIALLYNFMNDEYTRGRPHVGGDWDRHFALLQYDNQLTRDWRLDLSFGYRYDNLLHLYDQGGYNYEKNKKRFTDYIEFPAEIRITNNTFQDHTLTGGFFYSLTDTEQDYKDWITGTHLQQNEYKALTLSGYFQDAWKPVENLSVTAGLRYDHWKNYDNQFSAYENPEPGSRTDDTWSPKIGVKYSILKDTSVWANYSTGFRPPSPDELYDDRTMGGNPRQPNPDLDPEKTRAYEIGIEKWVGSLCKIQLIGFYSYTEDKISSWFNPDNVWVNKNIGESSSKGIEFDSTVFFSEAFHMTLNYTWNEAEIEENPSNPGQEGNTLSFSPEHKANLGLHYKKPQNYMLSLFCRYLDDQHTNDDNIKYTPEGEKKYMESSFVVDITAKKQFHINRGILKAIDLSLNLDNIFDEEYRTLYIYEDPGRRIYTELAFRF